MNAEAKKNIAPVEYSFPREDSYGFAGTLRSNYDLGWRANERLWLHACVMVERMSGATNREYVRNFLRSTSGRHLADDLSFRMPQSPDEDDVRAAIDQTEWKHWTKPFAAAVDATRKGYFNEQ